MAAEDRTQALQMEQRLRALQTINASKTGHLSPGKRAFSKADLKRLEALGYIVD